MKKLYLIGIVTLLLIGLLTWGIGPVMAQDGGKNYTKIDAPLSTEPEGLVHKIPRGSVIYHLTNGVTEVHGPDNSLLLSAKDSEARLIPTPGGPTRATYVHHIPSGSQIEQKGNITKIYKDGKLILTVIDNNKNQLSPPPTYSGWIESSDDWSVDAIDYFRAWWDAPSAPPSPGANVVDYLFNGIVPDTGGKIIQPVLEWNYGGSGRWTGAAWAVWGSGPNDRYRATGINVSTGDTIRGTMDWEKNYSGYWNVQFYDSDTGQSSSFDTTAINTDQSLAVFTALEGYYITDDGDVPGDTTFDSMVFQHDSNTVDITWVDNVRSGTGLTGLSVTIYSDNKVKLNTVN